MTKRIQNTLTVFLLGVFGLHLVAPLLLQGCIYYVKQEQRKVILENTHNPGLFKRIILSEGEFSALDIEEDNEFTIQDILYDIHSIKKENNQYIILALSDEQETNLERFHHQETSRELNSLNNTIKQFYFQLLYFEKAFRLPLMEASKRSKYLLSKTNSIVHPYLQILTPPPDFC